MRITNQFLSLLLVQITNLSVNIYQQIAFGNFKIVQNVMKLLKTVTHKHIHTNKNNIT